MSIYLVFYNGPGWVCSTARLHIYTNSHYLTQTHTLTHSASSFFFSLICWSSSFLFNEEVWKLSISLPPACPPQTPPGLWGICHGAVMGLCLLDFWCAISIWTDSDRTGSFLHLTLIQSSNTKWRHQCYCEYQLNVIRLSVCEILYSPLSVQVSFS